MSMLKIKKVIQLRLSPVKIKTKKAKLSLLTRRQERLSLKA